MLPIVGALLAEGLALTANALLAKGKDWVKEKTGVDLAAASLRPEDVAQLKQAEIDHQEELIRLRQADDRLSFEIEQAYLQDRQDARGMQKEALKQDDLFSKRFVYYFAIGWSAVTAAYIGCITFMVIPTTSVRFADTVLGFLLGTLIATMIQFFYGSSRSSQMKDETVRAAVAQGRRL